jgi:hypothetical protein
VKSPDQLRTLVPTAKHPLPTPRSAADARREVTYLELQKFAILLDRQQPFEEDEQRKDYPAAFVNYHHALWRWVWQYIPDGLTDKINNARFRLPDTPENAANICVSMHRYLLWRAVFLAGMKAAEGFKTGHYQYLAEHAKTAILLGDTAIFDSAKQRAWNARKAKVQHGRTEAERQLKYALLISWLAGGLWRASSRADQMDMLRKQHSEFPPCTAEAITMAQRRLGLRWYPP